MFKTIFLSLVVLVSSLTQSVKAELWGANQILEASCRITAGQYFGSGSCIKYDNGKYYVLTNAHVVGDSHIVYLEFFKNGRKTAPIPGEVTWKKLVPRTDVDFAIVAIDEKYFGKYPPRVAKLAPANTIALSGYVASAGCPGARWPSAFEGFVIREEAGRILFYPPPLGGQSGSGLYIVAKGKDGYETYLKGIITWRIGGGVPGKTTQMGYEENHGGAVVVDGLVSALQGQVGEPNIVPENYENVLFDRVRNILAPRPTYRPYVKPQVIVTPKVAPKPEPKVEPTQVIVPEPVLDRSKLLPLIKPDEPAPLPTPDVAPAPSDNPYDTVPDFTIPVEKPPIVQELEKKDELIEEKKDLVEENSFYKSILTWVAGLGGTGVLGALIAFAYKKGWIPFVWKKGTDKIEVLSDKVADGVAKVITPIVGVEVANKVRDEIDSKEDEIQKRIEARLKDKFGLTTTTVTPMQEVSFQQELVAETTNLTPYEAQDRVLNPAATAILTKNARDAMLLFLNRSIEDMLKDAE